MPAHSSCSSYASLLLSQPSRQRDHASSAQESAASTARRSCSLTATSRSSRPPDGVGGRVRSDRERGYVFDRGFAVFLEAYEESREALDYDALRLRPFQPGALICRDGEAQFVGDPLRRPTGPGPVAARAGGLFAPTSSGPAPCARPASRSTRPKLENGAWTRNSTDARDFLSQRVGVGPRLLDAFFEPFFRGVFLSRLEDQDPAGVVVGLSGRSPRRRRHYHKTASAPWRSSSPPAWTCD